MFAHFSSNSQSMADEISMPLDELTIDLKRSLSIQFREFINYIDDAQGEFTLEANTQVKSFLESCFKAA